MNSIKSKVRLIISVTIIWLFNISGIVGILMGYEDWFLPLTPLNLLIYLVLIIWNSQDMIRLLFFLMIPFCIGMITELLGVQYNLIFGSYDYGENLGYKVWGVPWIIGVNWALLVYCTAAISQKFCDNIWISSCIAALLMVGLDFIIEISAPRLDFWEFEGGNAPLQNYIGWLGTGYIAQIFFQKKIKAFCLTISLHIFIAILVFFTVFLFI
ncbi:carotenoid biosynthesis protein [Aquimarina pacifica]|uniref:carotenoid biosynthesis protein n=1 Tax=Aquimarina pacifica TaxID=1296415 RepID=UPI000471E489|nr:carotenoid biosynthesis protein [Aquimarina pacifica]